MNFRITVLSILCLIAVAAPVMADSVAVKKTSTNVVYTIPYKGPVTLESVAFTLPEAVTNTFTISATRDIVERTLVGTQITTNLYGRLETNTNHQVSVETHIVLTNLLVSVSTTNQTTTRVYSSESVIPEGYQLTEGDKLIYTWDDTNTFYFIQSFHIE